MHGQFPNEVIERLNYYVYRLIDPRNGQTFYVGKGRGNRIFQHLSEAEVLAKTTVEGAEDEESLKIQTIRAIKRAGFEPLHIIHRHGLDEATTFEVEAALIDAYPGLSNAVSGHGNGEKGCRHAEELVRIYAARSLVPKEDLILIYVGKALDEGRDVYDAVRAAWKMSLRKAEKRKLVLAYDGGLVIGAYRPKVWLPATKSNFPFLARDIDGRIGFTGSPANDVWDYYVHCRPPARKKGTQTPFSYLDVPDRASN